MLKELVVVTTMASAVGARGESTQSSPESVLDSVAESSTATGKSMTADSSSAMTWDAIWKTAADLGIGLSLVYDGEGVVNATGGVQTGSAYVGNFHMMLTVDAARLLGWQGATLFLNGLVTHGGHPSDLVGDAQGVSNLDAPPRAQLYEAWFQQNLFENRLSALVGRYDLNTEFYRLQSATLFVNSSFGVGPEFSQSGIGGPSLFPDTSVGARIAFKTARDVVIRAAILDGAPVDRPDGGVRIFAKGDGLLLVGEAAFLARPSPEGRPTSMRFRIGRNSGLLPYEGKIAFGGWYYTARFDDLSEEGPNGKPVQHNGSGGLYFLADELVYRRSDSPRQISAFAQVGLGDSRVNRFGWYVGGGLVVSSLLPALPNDELGLAVAIARNGSHFIEHQQESGIRVTGTETAAELTYLVQMGDHFALQPDFQYVIQPGTNPTRKNAFVVGLRFELSY